MGTMKYYVLALVTSFFMSMVATIIFLSYFQEHEYQLAESYSTTTPMLEYYVPVDIQEPLPYIYEPEQR